MINVVAIGFIVLKHANLVWRPDYEVKLDKAINAMVMTALNNKTRETVKLDPRPQMPSFNTVKKKLKHRVEHNNECQMVDALILEVQCEHENAEQMKMLMHIAYLPINQFGKTITYGLAQIGKESIIKNAILAHKAYEIQILIAYRKGIPAITMYDIMSIEWSMCTVKNHLLILIGTDGRKLLQLVEHT